jgi:type I restriction enzyme S subunit
MSNENNKTALPKLRFPEFQGAKGWVEKKLSNIMVEARLGSNFQTSEASSGTPVIKMVNLNRGRININKVEYLIENSTYNEYDLLKAGDLLFNTRNTLELVGKVAIWNNELPLAVYNTNLLRLVFDDKVVSSNHFMNYLLNTREALEKLRSIATGTTSVAAIYSKDLNKLIVNIPSPEEQEKIASTLSSLDDLLTAQSAKLEALKVHKRGLMQALFPAEGETVPKLRFPEFQEAEEWEEKPLGDIAKFSSGGTPSKDKPEFWDGNTPWISASSMHDYVIDESELYITDAAKKAGAAVVGEGVLLLLVRGSMLFKRIPMGITAREVAFNQDVKALHLDKEIAPLYLLYYLVSAESSLLGKVSATGIGAGKLDTSELKQFPVFIPSSIEQEKIIECLSSLDNRITAQSQKIEALKLHKKGLMQALFPSLTNPEE